MRGFTLVELLVVVGITAIIAVAAVPMYGGLQVSAQLNETSAQLIQTLRRAKVRSETRFNGTTHGVYIKIDPSAEDSFILYQGNSYSSRSLDLDQSITLEAPLSLSTTIAGNDIHFAGGAGVPSATGTITITHAVSGSRIVTINNVGAVKEDN